MFSQFYTMFQLSDYKKGSSIQEIFKSTRKIHFIVADQRMFVITGFAQITVSHYAFAEAQYISGSMVSAKAPPAP